MMKLKKLEISGFKSFVDPVVLNFSPGVTGIVGPNGCGKSNLSDAISWVLGEQSAKSLRSGSMEDVIFSGSERRKPLGMAEVTLTLETDSSFQGAVEGQIVINRRVYRGGEGQYRLNGRRVRLKEIRDLLMGTGLGIRAYSIIGQGKIGLILSGKPQERRKLLEEAAGVTRYKQRRRIAELKLEEATANLLRLEDIVSEVDRALRSLKRQASAARRFAAKKEEYRILLDQVLRGRWVRLSEAQSERRLDLEKRTDIDAKLVAEVHRLEADLIAKRQSLDSLAQRVGALHQKDAELAATIEGRQALLKGAQETLDQIVERRTSGEAAAAERNQLAVRNQSALLELAKQSAALAAEHEQARQAVAGDQTALSDRAANLGDTERQVGQLRQAILDSVGRSNASRGVLHRQNVETEKAVLRQSHLKDERESHTQELQEAQTLLEGSNKTVSTHQAAIEKRQAERASLEDSLQAELAQEARLTQGLQQHREKLATVSRRLDVLHQLDAAHVRGREGLLTKLQEIGIQSPEFLGDLTRAPEGWGRCIDFYLESLSEAVLVPEGTDPLEIADALRETRTAAVLLAPVESSATSTLRDPAIVTSVAAALEIPENLARALPPSYLVETAEQAERLARQHPESAFASREGLWAQGGLLHLEGERTVPGVLERRQEAESLQRTVPDLDDELKQSEAQLEAAIGQRTRRAEEIHRLDEALAGTQRELAVAQARREDVASRIRRLEREGSSYEKETLALNENRERLAETTHAAALQVEELEASHVQLQKQFELAEELLNEARREREHLRAEGAVRQGRLDLLAERLRGFGLERTRIEREIAAAGEFKERWTQEAQGLDAREQSLKTSQLQAQQELTESLGARDGSQEAILAAQAVLDEHREEVRTIEGSVEVKRGSREEVRDAVESVRVQIAGLQQEEQHLRETYREQLDQDLPQKAAPIDQELDALESELQQTKTALERLGPVNELAGQEFDEHQERHTYLVEQRVDVASSVASLKKTIHEINQTSSERFLATFAEVNQKFGEVFQSLFSGGEAEMRLLDEEDVLESGIEIMARPPGKRLQNLLLLSGGEKALTAIALLMALFHTKASPFCIFDEVDAPLDDPNTVRFVEIIKKMSLETQFIVITHNKLTMQAASTLYGVTMQERGVSKTVSVELDEVQPAAQLVSAS